MAVNNFSPAENRVPTSIGTVEVYLRVIPAGVDPLGVPIPEQKTAEYRFEILDQDGMQIYTPWTNGDLVPHLSQADTTMLIDFMTRIRAQIEAQVLPQIP